MDNTDDTLRTCWKKEHIMVIFLCEVQSTKILIMLTNSLGNLVQQQADTTFKRKAYTLYFECSVLAFNNLNYILGTECCKF